MRAQTTRSCAVVGAGAAGLTAARLLRAQGLAVTVFDKGRQPGGRLASRLTAHGVFDHGVKYLDDEQLGSQPTLALRRQGHADTWMISDLRNRQQPLRQTLIGVPSNNQIAHCWAQGLSLHREQRVESIRQAQQGWQIQIAGQPPPQLFDAVVVTVPCPQLQPLLPELALPGGLGRIAYNPCWTLMWVPTSADLPELLPCSPLHHPSIEWLAREDSKPGRGGPPRYLVQATAQWSLSMLEHPAETVAAALQNEAAAALGIAPGAHFAVAHRWRFARVRQSLGLPQLRLAPGLHYASDGCLGDGLEHAIASGTAAAMALLDHAH